MASSSPTPVAPENLTSVPQVVLVTTFPPTAGGGSAILRSLLSHFTRVRVRWIYLAPADLSLPDARWLGPALQEFSLWRDMLAVTRGWILRSHPRLRRYAREICAEAGDVFWIVGHNEGLLLAEEVARFDPRPMHLTVHDDIPEGVFGRSRRYRWLRGFARSALRKALQTARSVDVVSAGMRRYYQKEYGLEHAEIVLPYCPTAPPAGVGPGASFADGSSLCCGHIGAIYHLEEFAAFCRVFVQVAKKRNQSPKLLLIGVGKYKLKQLQEFSACIENYPSLTEPEAVAKLARCDLVYAMYPFAAESAVFRRTSLPTKLSTYVQCMRPVFAHTPADSTLAEIVDTFGIGGVCDSLRTDDIASVLRTILAGDWQPTAFERLREDYYGFHNVQRMERFLSGSAVQLKSV